MSPSVFSYLPITRADLVQDLVFHLVTQLELANGLTARAEKQAQKGQLTQAELQAEKARIDEIQRQEEQEKKDDTRRLHYADVYDGVDIEYVSLTNGLKENIVVHRPISQTSFTFDLALQGLTVQQREEGLILVDSQGVERLTLGELYAYDAAGESTYNVEYQYDEKKNQLTVSLDPAWMGSQERVYPVVIDPTIMITGQDYTADTYIRSNPPSANGYHTQQYLYTGYTATNGNMRSLIKFTLPYYLRSQHITSSYMRIKQYSGSTPSLRAYAITASWNENSVSWSTQPSASTSYVSSSFYSGSWYQFDITSTVKGWTNTPSSNYGVKIQAATENSTSHYTTYYAANAPYPNRPELHITYSGNYGERDVPPPQHMNPITPQELDAMRNINCLGYAVNSKNFTTQNPKLLLTDKESQDVINNKSLALYLSFIKSKAEAYMRSRNIVFSELSSYDQYIPQNYFRVALRVGLAGGSEWLSKNLDFHFIYQSKTGQWYEKRGTEPVNGVPNMGGTSNPGASPWLWGKGSYSSATIYYRVLLQQ